MPSAPHSHDDDDDDGHSPPGLAQATGVGGSSKPHRILACLLCQQRKVKCDRKFPCANCSRSGAQCVPATLLPRQRRRRFPERELLDRLRHYEQLLRSHNIPFEPLHKPQPSLGKGTDAGGGDNDRHDDHGSQAQAQSQSPSTGDKPDTDYKAKDIWDAMGHPGAEYSDDSDGGVEAAGVRKLWDRVYSQTDHMLFGTRIDPVDLSPLHPGPAEIFRLWQTYMDNVSPVLNVTHSPTLQNRIIEAAGNVASIEPVTEALMFSVYVTAVISLPPEDCRTYFMASKQDLMMRYHFGCQQALMNCGLLRTTSRDTLTAFFMYLVSLAGTTHPQTVYSLLAIAVRVAKRLGMDNEDSLASHTPFEAEMRRRLWWSIVMFDYRAGEKTDQKNSQLNPSWDCRIPLNISDVDLRPECKDLETVRGRSTEAVFGLIRAELGDYLRHASYHLDFSAPSLRPIARPSSLDLDGFKRHLEERYIQHFDPTNPVHHLAKWTAYSYLARYSLWRQFAALADRDGKRPSAADWEAAIINGVEMLEADRELMASPLTKRYHWFLSFYFPLPAYLIIAKSLKARPLSVSAQRAWEVMGDNFAVRLQTIFRQEVAPFMRLFNPLFQAWDVTVKAHSTNNIAGPQQPLPAPPRILAYIREIRASDTSGGFTGSTSSSSPTLNTELDDEMMLSPDLFNPALALQFTSNYYHSTNLFDSMAMGDNGNDTLSGIDWSTTTSGSTHGNGASSATTNSVATSLSPESKALSNFSPSVGVGGASPSMGGTMPNWFGPLPTSSHSMGPMMSAQLQQQQYHVMLDHKALETLNIGEFSWTDLDARDRKG